MSNTTKKISSFRNEYYFLSNMFPCKIVINGFEFSCAEAAFQAGKCKTKKDAMRFVGIDGYAAKKLGREIDMRDDWNEFRLGHMATVLRAKFSQNRDLLEKLDNTTEYLEEGNTWNDRFWGVCNGRGKNYLGKMLMDIRERKLNDNYLSDLSDWVKEDATLVLEDAINNFKLEYIDIMEEMQIKSRPAINQGVDAKDFSRAFGKFNTRSGYRLYFEVGYDIEDDVYAVMKHYENCDKNEPVVKEFSEEMTEKLIRLFEYKYSWYDEIIRKQGDARGVASIDEETEDFLGEASVDAWQSTISWNEENSEYESDFSKLVGNWNGKLRSYRDDEPSYYKEFHSSQLPELKLKKQNYFHSFDKKTTIKAPKAGDMTLREMYTLGLVRG